MKNRQRSLVIVVVASLCLGLCSAEAAIYSVPLPEFIGEIETHPNESVAAFDFGTSFVDIYQVRIQVAGTFTTGLAHGDGVEIPAEETFVLIPNIGIYMGDPDPGFAYTAVYPTETPFVIEGAIDLWLGATWDFLLDGAGEATALLGWEGGVGRVMDIEPTVTVTDAYLVIEGIAVPEPATGLLVVCGGSIFLRSRRRRVGSTRMR